MINVGDLVVHDPEGSVVCNYIPIRPAFKIGLVTQIKNGDDLDFARVIPVGDNTVELWFACDELKILNEVK